MSLCFTIILAVCGSTSGGGRPELTEPADGRVVHMAIPHFVWQPTLKPDVRAMPSYVIQIASDAAFSRVVDEDTLAAVIAHYVPDGPLPPGQYFWRVAAVPAGEASGPWSAARTFTIRRTRAFPVRAGASFERIRGVIAHAAAASPASVVFEKGTYRLSPDKPLPLVELTGTADLTIDGNGATVIFTRPAPVARLERCRRVLLRGFVFDYDPPVYTAGRIAAVDAKAGTIDVEILPGHSLPDWHERYAEDGKGQVVTAADGCAVKRGVRLVVAHAGFERVEGRRYRFRLGRARDARQLAPGDVYVLGPRWQQAGGGSTVCVLGGENAVLYDLTLYGGANECLGSFYADGHAILKVRLVRNAGRALSVNNGGNNHHNARTGPWIEGCLFENTGDDVCHVNGYAMSIVDQPAPDRIRVRIPTPYDQYATEAALGFRVGDRLQFFCRREGRLIGERQVRAVRQGRNVLDVTLNKGINGITPGRLLPAKGAAYARTDNTAITHAFNASRTCNQFVFRHNLARRGRRIGVLAKGSGGLIEHNVFEDLGGGGVEFWNAPFEGLAAENYVVRHNRIVHCLRLSRRDAAIWCTAFRSGGSRIHRNLLIEDNEIAGEGWPAIDVSDAENVVCRRNRIVRPEGGDVARDQRIRFRNVSGLLREANTVRPKEKR